MRRLCGCQGSFLLLTTGLHGSGSPAWAAVFAGVIGPGDTTAGQQEGGLPRLCLDRPPGLGGASCFMGGVSGTIQAVEGAAQGSASLAGLFRLQRRAAAPPNNAMQLTKLRAAPVRQAEVPPCAPAGQTDGGTASQLIASVRRLIAVRACRRMGGW